MNAMHISLAVLAVVAVLVAGFFLLRRKPLPPLTEAQEALIERALSEHLAPGQSITFGGANAERLQAEYERRRAELDAASSGAHMTMEEFLGSFNFEPDSIKVGLFTRKPDPTEESMATREESMAAYRSMGASPGNAAACSGCVSGTEYTRGNTRHDALKAAKAKFDGHIADARAAHGMTQAQHEQLAKTPITTLRERALRVIESQHPFSESVFASRLLWPEGPLMVPVPAEHAEKVKSVLTRLVSMLPYMAWTDRMMATAKELGVDIWGVEYDPSILAGVADEADSDASSMLPREEAQKLVDAVNHHQAELDKAVAAMIRELPANAVNRGRMEQHERETALRVLTEIVDKEPVKGLTRLCNVESWRVALQPKVDESQLFHPGEGGDIEIGRIDSVRFVESPFEPDDGQDDQASAKPSAVERAYREGFTDAIYCYDSAQDADNAWQISVARQQMMEANATQSQVQQSKTEGADDTRITLPVKEMREEPEPDSTSGLFLAKERASSSLVGQNQLARQATEEELAPSLAKAAKEVIDAAKAIGIPEEAAKGLLTDAARSALDGVTLAGFESDGMGGMFARFNRVEPIQTDPELLSMLKKLDEDMAKAGGKDAEKAPAGPGLSWREEQARFFGVRPDDIPADASPEETSSTRARPDSTESGIASSYPVAENAGLTSDSIDFGIARRYPFVSRFGRHDGKFGHEPAHDEGSQP